ncbi:MAG: leucine-rich repeat protein [Tidjanibacter sp.]|nr:leucine-rich repeat protein [Tidjanibacter sp.]
MKRFLYLLPLLTGLILTSCYDEEIEKINGRLDSIENTQITTISQQITSINNSILLLNSTDKELNAYITALEAEAENLQAQITTTNTKIDEVKTEVLSTISSEKANILAELEAFKATVNGELDAIKAVLETLKAKDAELDGKIATLQEYVDTELKATEDWATATFSTLEQYNEVVATIATIEGTIEGINESIAALETRFNEKIAKDIETACVTLSADLQNAVKDVTEAYTSAIATAKNELTEAYTAALEGAISALEASMKEWVYEQLAGYYTIAEMDAKLQVMQTALENKITASENYLKGLISDLESVINEKIAENSKLIATLSASLSSLEGTLADRAQDIIANTQAIEENAKNIKENAEKILANGENVQANADLIAENKTLIAQNEQLIKSNLSAIAALQNGVSVNSQTIATNATNIATNASDIATNAAHIANNASAIADNLAAIATNATNIAKLQSELEATANEITEAYTNAIATAIATNNGEIEEKIATEIQKVNDKIDALTQRVSTLEQTVSNISTRLEGVEGDIVDIQEQLTALVNRIQSISYIPQYSDGKATIDTDKKIGVFDFKISPKDAIVDLVNVWETALTMEAVHTQTRAVSFIELPITYFEADVNNGTFSIEIDATNLGDNFFSGEIEASVALTISDGNNNYTSSYINLALGTVKSLKNTPANNEIWYTATEKVEPKYGNGFGANYMAEKSTFNPSTGNGIMVFDGDITSLGQSEFYNNQALTSITLPQSITSIPYENVSNATFEWCTNLKEFKGKFASEDGRSLIIDNVLIAIAPSGLTSFSIPSGIKTIGTYAFAYYDQIESVNIPYGVETIGNSAFYKAGGLKSISIPRSVKEIKAYAFYLATALESIEFIDGNYSSSRTIGVSAFESCTSLKELTIPQGVTEIPQSMCHNCTSLTTITLPNSISTINSYSLNCTNLETVCCLKTTAPTLYSNAFGYSTPSALKIYVDSSALSSYKSSWSAYKDRIFDKEILKHQPVDLGLSVLWSSCNLYGREYDKSDLYGWYDSFDGKCGFEWSSVDPATAMLGDKWRVPTKAEWEELLANCKVYFSTESYASHMVVESKVNGNKIYLPAGEPGDLDYYGCSRYWSSSANNSSSAHGFYFYLSLSDDGSTAYKYMTTYSKTTKCLIRPVYIQ